MDDILKRRITTLIYDEYRKLKPSSKPVIKSNGTKEWTVLAGIIAWDHKTNTIQMICISTGVKALPNELLVRSNGKMLHDCHAEILSIRGLNAVILNHIKNLKEGGTSDLINQIGDKYEWKKENKLILYISRVPCGDASMDTIESQDDTSESYEILDENKMQYLDERNNTILRGRLNFSKKGVVRSKPGRYDSQITLSKSCSDKLCTKQVTSLLNCLTYELLSKPLYLDYILIPSLTRTDLIGLKRCFQDRLGGTSNEEQSHKPKKFKIENCDEKFLDDKQSKDETPSAMSSIKLYYDKSNVQEQAILNGVKNGSFTKGSKPLRKGCETAISRYSQWNLYNQINPVQDKSYLQFKKEHKTRRTMVEYIRQKLSSDGWIKTLEDNCSI
ncbi:similar to Saccharomyces cerevisiae YGL243W TAD1 tRNA-specific adenosine deaminase, deaminates adenosine-37 to inosine in tRNA-Ala [Maudiozyma saulgeensis]|uniref:Similar to Saccharomyces cerevisiae YGL243W TAD1 tRNA-specific adenosine deaminase, deaminates adenosine-37 to inosine in tRNA-Ala n=1 Tax=Maudiozyma saulgeensis TaxID=1789683 RepID=A0A1X7QX87_9SACH|nr:similar to Saccharomyces cerevisiae YGL243W TAD1 tRNA-specific adenosine deaminase, deaminates adenosine-37 to inosine in tRNA-Ala [Kazachstania saulgeensis]